MLLTVDDVLGEIDVHRLTQLSFWDALLVETLGVRAARRADRRLAGWEAIRRAAGGGTRKPRRDR